MVQIIKEIIMGRKKFVLRKVWKIKWYHLELNQGHTDFQSVALPAELWYHKENEHTPFIRGCKSK